MSPAPSAYVARRGDQYSLRCSLGGEFMLPPIAGGLRGLLQIEVEEVHDDGSVTELTRLFLMPGMMRDPSYGDDVWMSDPPGEGWRWRDEKKAFQRRRRHEVWIMAANEAEALVAKLRESCPTPRPPREIYWH